MKRTLSLLILPLLLLCIVSCNKRSGKPRILVFSKTAAFRHSSIETGKQALIKLGAENNMVVDTTEDASYFNEDSLKNYSAVVFLHTTGDVLNNFQEADFQRYIEAGGGFVGIHAATDTEYDWGWYGRLVGGYFHSHPEIQAATLNVIDKQHPSTKHLPDQWKRTDEWYNFKSLNKDVKVLMTIDESSYKGGNHGKDHPMAWYHEYSGGRSFYTELGHTEESFAEQNFLKHVLGGLQYAIGDNNKLDYGKAVTQRPPDEDRFVATRLVSGNFFEPTEMAVLPNLDILVAQRRGELMLVKNGDSSARQVGYLNVYWKTNTPGVNAEEGLLGLQADPDYAKNNFVYLFYSPIDTSVNRLSRFIFKNDSLHMASEKVILQFYSQREICCHTGGSIAFGPDRTLYLSTGDNSTPFDQPGQYQNHGFAPIDQRPGFEQYDARRTSGNTNDLRGKILRIRVNEDGTYTIPEGNLFKPGTDKTRPEIFVMGNRNPYRISVDKKTGALYWGEVGPDAGNDSLETRGPRGYDEVNRAATAGYYGWPLFVGNNYAYRDYDYNTGKSGDFFKAEGPINNSRNNTGLQQLPPARPAYIWYPYAASADFPQTGTGGRNAMAGPVYYSDMYPEKTRLPDYFNGKLFIYDWMRGWIKVVHMNEDGSFGKMEPFMPSLKLANAIDMEMGPDGKMYLLEYGTGWFSRNADAGLLRIDYNPGNRAPKVGQLTIDKTSGALPFAVNLSIEAKDPEKKPLKFKWHIGNEIKESNEPTLQHTFNKAGDYPVYVEVIDESKETVKSNTVSVYAGNEAPQVSINIIGNKTFYFPGKPVQYEVRVTDKEEGASIVLENLFVTANYQSGMDQASTQGHKQLSEAMTGKTIMESLDCKACHKVNEKSIGPSYIDVAKRYEKDPNAVSYLVGKIIKGGGGVWGETAMSAHPDLPESDARQIVTWIRSLTVESKQAASLPPQGTIPSSIGKPTAEDAVLLISATYSDKGGNSIKPQTNYATVALRSTTLNFKGVKNVEAYSSIDMNGRTIMITPKSEGHFSIDSIDLTGVSAATATVGWQAPPSHGYVFEIRLDGASGTKLGQFVIPGRGASKPNETPSFTQINFSLQPVTDGKFHNLYIVSRPSDPKEASQVGLVSIQLK